MERHCPDILAATRAAVARSKRVKLDGDARIQLDADSFSAVPDDSIDFAVMEKSSKVAVEPCRIGWSDIGSWDALGALVEPDAHGNRIERGETALHDVSDCYIRGGERMIGAVGVDKLIVIDTPDALLVARRDRAQDVKHLYAGLKARGHETYKLHRTVNRPWGSYTVLETGPNFKIKRIEVKPGASLSLQMHYHRSEHWIVVSGMARVINGEREMLVNTNESTYIPAGHRHRLENPGLLPLVMIEVQSGAYLGEDDIVRFDDVYGRVPDENQESR
jgi:mannose-1-phosphate guanylyltransferase